MCTCPVLAGAELPKPPRPAPSRRRPGRFGWGPQFRDRCPTSPGRRRGWGCPFATIPTRVAEKRRKPHQHQGANYSFISSQCISLSALCFSVQC